jgi:hypothetical protein
MRIKLFESFNTEDYYQEISFSEYMYNLRMRITISDILHNNFLSLFDMSKWREIGHYHHNDELNSVMITNPIEETDICIGVLDDDWYLVRLVLYQSNDSDTYWKCDQMDGLKKLLKDKKYMTD